MDKKKHSFTRGFYSKFTFLLEQMSYQNLLRVEEFSKLPAITRLAESAVEQVTVGGPTEI